MIDDHMIDEALGSLIKQKTLPDSADPRVVRLVDTLERIRNLREEVPDAIWTSGLRTVRESVRRHSGCLPGQTGYLDFVKDYVR